MQSGLGPQQHLCLSSTTMCLSSTTMCLLSTTLCFSSTMCLLSTLLVLWTEVSHSTKSTKLKTLVVKLLGARSSQKTGQPVVIYLQGLVAHLAGSSCSKSWWPASLLLSGRFGGEIMSYIASEVVHAAQTVRVWKPVTLSKAGSASTEDSVTCSLGSKCHDV